MKKLLTLVAFAAAALAANAETSVGVSVGIDQPGFYGRIEVGNRPPPPVVYTQPVIIVNSPVSVHRRPIYMHVPPGHQKNWAKHCHRYDACGQPVHFVREEWVAEHHRHMTPAPHVHVVHDHHSAKGPKGHGGGNGHGQGHSHGGDGHGRGKGR
jgi:hypothetical protein